MIWSGGEWEKRKKQNERTYERKKKKTLAEDRESMCIRSRARRCVVVICAHASSFSRVAIKYLLCHGLYHTHHNTRIHAYTASDEQPSFKYKNIEAIKIFEIDLISKYFLFVALPAAYISLVSQNHI